MANALTITDLDLVLEDERHLGFGYADRQHLPYGKRTRLDRYVVEVANELGLDAEALFQWANSKNGRWLCDEVSSVAWPSEALVRTYLNEHVLAHLRAEAEAV